MSIVLYKLLSDHIEKVDIDSVHQFLKILIMLTTLFLDNSLTIFICEKKNIKALYVFNVILN